MAHRLYFPALPSLTGKGVEMSAFQMIYGRKLKNALAVMLMVSAISTNAVAASFSCAGFVELLSKGTEEVLQELQIPIGIDVWESKGISQLARRNDLTIATPRGIRRLSVKDISFPVSHGFTVAKFEAHVEALDIHDARRIFDSVAKGAEQHMPSFYGPLRLYFDGNEMYLTSADIVKGKFHPDQRSLVISFGNSFGSGSSSDLKVETHIAGIYGALINSNMRAGFRKVLPY
jgi:hypothetical protein